MHGGIIYPTKSNRINEWYRIDKDCKCYVNTWSNGLKWNKVISRTTYDMYSGRIINHLVFNENPNPEDVHKKLPERIVWIKTVLLFRTE